MVKLKKILPFLISSMLYGATGNAQGLAQGLQETEVRNTVPGFAETSLREKIFLQTDRDVYVTGEICWFNLFCLNAASNSRSLLSREAYVEVLDRNRHTVLQARVKLENGVGTGSFFLPLTLPSDQYTIRAYTSLMRNYSVSLFFSKSLEILNPSLSAVAIEAAKANYDLQFFPEGGNLINGISTKIAFKLADRQGQGRACSGKILDQNGETVVEFSTLRYGMGHFMLRPEKGRRYHALVNVPQASPLQTGLKPAKDEGYALSVRDSGAAILLDIQASDAFKNAAVRLLQLRGKTVVRAWNLLLNAGHAGLSLDRNKLPGGLSTFIVFEETGRAVAERLIFTPPAAPLQISADSLAGDYQTRSRILFSLHLSDSLARSRQGHLSVGVTRLDTLQSTTGSDIYSYAWLESELKGSVEDPSFYMNPKNPGWKEALENLLLVHAYRAFADSGANKKQAQLHYLPELETHLVRGRVIDERTNRGQKGVFAFLTVTGPNPKFYVSRSDSSGAIKFVINDFYGPAELIAQVNSRTDSTCRVEIESPFSSDSGSALPELSRLDYRLAGPLLARSISMQVQNVFHDADLKTFRPERADTSSFYGVPNRRYLLDDFTRFTTLEEVIREYVRSTVLTIHQKKFRIRVFHPYANEVFSEQPLILFDGVPVFSDDQMIRQDPLKIKGLDVLTSVNYVGSLAAPGILSFSSYKGDFPGLQLDPRVLVLDYEGLQQSRVFYSPRYATLKSQTSRMPDFRTTLFWLPVVTTGLNGNAKIDFYSSDVKGSYRITVQAVSQDGKQLGHRDFNFEVK